MVHHRQSRADQTEASYQEAQTATKRRPCRNDMHDKYEMNKSKNGCVSNKDVWKLICDNRLFKDENGRN
jgi:hypothetical protein